MQDLYSESLKKKDNENKKEQKKQKKAGRRKIIVTLILVVVFLIVIINIVVPKKSSKIVTGYIQNGTLEKTSSGTLKLLRKEIIVNTESDGKVIAAIKEGERAAKGETVAYITSAENEETALELIKVDTQIVAADTYSDSTFNTILSGGSHLSDAILKTLTGSSVNAVKGSLKNFKDNEAGLDTYFTLKNSVSGDVKSKEEYINGLQAKKKELLNKMGSGTLKLTAPESGIVSYHIDGNEEYINELEFDKVRSYDLRNINGNGESTSGTSVKTGDAVFTILNAIDYYALITLPRYSMDVYSPGKTITVQADNREFSFKGTVVRFEKDEEGAELLLKCNASQPSTVSYRTRNVDLILESVSGMKVPVKALTDWDSAKVTAKITLIRANFVESLYVNVDSYNDEYAIISNRYSYGEETAKAASANDMYVQNPEVVKDGELLE